MNVLDITLLGLLVIGLVRGFWRGLFVEVASLLALVAGVYGAFHFSDFASEFLREKVDWNENTINIVAFVGTLILIVLIVSLAGKALTKIADFAALGLFNKALGALFGGLKIALILSAILIIFEKLNRTIPFTAEEDKEVSVLYTPVKSIVPLIFPNLIVNGKPIGDDLANENSEN
ncbi:membrane protein required for colicin V production [Mariniflexile fucanivorans]|uniref:Membrane protein required for colicin V production n=1 Tax=Mariniflexile fucanivorans TaxID=264023 RepID=A0A4V2QDG6_9FLAO|nr:CvpA family protein [Mariniflexile fucanivorans]TCL63577.1 membrane protein required for colicin V production [Mariniflexile fucanivorans]